MPDRPPRAHVLRLLLRPDDLLKRRIRLQQLPRRLDREWVELLESRDGDVVRLGPCLVADDVVVDLP